MKKLPGPIRIMIYDDSTIDDGVDIKEDALAYSWVGGAKLYKALRALDVSLGCKTVDEMLDGILRLSAGRQIQSIQFWAHGSPGRLWFNREKFDIFSLVRNGPVQEKLLQIKSRLVGPEALIWFRTCSTFCGTPGHEFAEELANMMNCTVAGHTYIIGPFQGGLRTLKPGQKPYWPLEEGILEGSPESYRSIKKIKVSKWWGKQPNTIFCLRGSIPEGW